MLQISWSCGRWMILGLVFSVIAGGSLRYAGFCFKEARYLSDMEITRSAIDYVLWRQSADRQIAKVVEENQVRKIIPVNDNDRYFGYIHKKYKDAEEFVRENPDCCLLAKWAGDGYKGSFVDWLSGHILTWVTVKYEANFYDEKGIEYSKTDQMSVAVSSCGKAWDGN